MVFAVSRGYKRGNGDYCGCGASMKNAEKAKISEERLTAKLNAASPKECARLTKKLVALKLKRKEKI